MKPKRKKGDTNGAVHRFDCPFPILYNYNTNVKSATARAANSKLGSILVSERVGASLVPPEEEAVEAGAV